MFKASGGIRRSPAHACERHGVSDERHSMRLFGEGRLSGDAPTAAIGADSRCRRRSVVALYIGTDDQPVIGLCPLGFFVERFKSGDIRLGNLQVGPRDPFGDIVQVSSEP